LKYSYPIDEHKELINPSVGELFKLFGLIKAIVVDKKGIETPWNQ